MEIGTREEKLLTVQEVAQILKVPPFWVHGGDRSERDARAGSDGTTGPRTLFAPDDADLLCTVGRRIAAACRCQIGGSDAHYLRPSCDSDAPKRGAGFG
jgi:hypothetical protein